jgi:hypothetical protein
MIDAIYKGAQIRVLAYFTKMKVGLSNHQSVCFSVCVSLNNNFWTDRWIFMKIYTDDATEGDLEATRSFSYSKMVDV